MLKQDKEHEQFLKELMAYVEARYIPPDSAVSAIGDIIGTLGKTIGRTSRRDAFSSPGADVLTSLLKLSERTFSETVLRLMEKRDLKPADIYKKTGLSKSNFSKIKNNRDYHPSKDVALAFAIALRLTLDETNDLLRRAGYSISRSQKRDIIIEYYIKQGIYDTDLLNIDLDELGFDPLTNNR